MHAHRSKPVLQCDVSVSNLLSSAKNFAFDLKIYSKLFICLWKAINLGLRVSPKKSKPTGRVSWQFSASSKGQN